MILKLDDVSYEFTTILEDDKNASVFKHFKGNLYKILTIANSCDDLSLVVVYQKQYDDYGFFTRTASEFFSDVDKQKYPNVMQNKRFEKLS